MKERNDQIKKLTANLAQLRITINLREARERNEADTWQRSVEKVTFGKYKAKTENYRVVLNENRIALIKLKMPSEI